MTPGQEIRGFRVVDVSELRNLRSTAVAIEHIATGAKVLHIHNADTENLFSVTFPTPPDDDTGLPHIMEHSVLDGSKRFPVRRPFFEMLKMSMATFINAMTSSDLTIYPCSSTVERDLFNLAEVYFDAVFHPTLTEETLRQEGHSLGFERPGDPSSALIINGIVYNEMKGVFSDPESIAYRRIEGGLLPDTPYARESGGDPEHIPELTYEAFLDFHRRRYNPSNAHFVFYGNIATEKHLAFLEERLAGFGPGERTGPIPRQPRWSEPRVIEESYPVAPDGKTASRSYLVSVWLTGDATDPREGLAFDILNLYLMGNQAAPLRRALIESGLGEDVALTGATSDGAEGLFSIGLKGTEPSRREAFERLVADTLRKIASSGIDPDRLAAAFQQIAYRHLEVRDHFPLNVLYNVIALWPYGADPLALLRADEIIRDLRRECDADPGFLPRLIIERIVENPHRLTLVLRPEPGLQERRNDALRQRLAERKAAMSPDSLLRVAEESVRLKELQAKPNPPEALATLPQLKVADLPARPRHISTSVEDAGPRLVILRNDVFTNGVSYLAMDLELDGLPVELCPYLLLYRDCVVKMGAAGQDYVRMAERLSSSTGGVHFRPALATHSSAPGRTPFRGRFTMKALDENVSKALGVLGDLAFSLDPRDAARLADVTRQRRANLRADIAELSSGLARMRSARHLGAVAGLNDLVHGLPYFQLIEDAAERFDERKGELVEKLEAIREHMKRSSRIVASFTGSDEACASVRSALGEWAAALYEPPAERPRPVFGLEPARSGLAVPLDVAHCAEALPAPPSTHPDSPLYSVGGGLMSIDYMLPEIRMKGGAYGSGSGYNAHTGVWSFTSYRDPSVVGTLRTFDGAADYLRRAEWTAEDVERAVIGASKDAERPIRPESATETALSRHVLGETPEVREARYAARLRATPAEVKRALLELIESGRSRAGVCVASSRETLLAANEHLAGQPEGALVIEDVL